ncbi:MULTISPECIES: GpE family phage tail protein [Acinetobacter]|nr:MULTISPECIES: GpE family phage tail protein [Acinetobacter]MBJ9370570.1 GpE family phage tail protein [Acinetobacter sp. TGL-Y2]MDA3440028.1 GpE family phage tail protein [Acinetobacter bereziniae]
MANIALIFHWSPRDFAEMNLADLFMWHQKAIERNQSE